MSDSNTLYQKPVQEVFEILKTRHEGLSKNEAAKRLRKYGKNELRAKIKFPVWLILLSQFKELLILILIIGGDLPLYPVRF